MTKKSAIERDLVFLDIETSGLDPKFHEILELAAVRTCPKANTIRNVVECLTLPVKIHTAEPEALRINGYDGRRWTSEAIPLSMALQGLKDLCGTPNGEGGVTLVAHSATFDWGFLHKGLRKSGLDLDADNHVICTASMAWPFLMRGEVEKPKLEALCTFFGVPNDGQHTAMRDVERMMEVYRHIMYRFRTNAYWSQELTKWSTLRENLRDAAEALVRESPGACQNFVPPLSKALEALEAAENEVMNDARLRDLR